MSGGVYKNTIQKLVKQKITVLEGEISTQIGNV